MLPATAPASARPDARAPGGGSPGANAPAPGDGPPRARTCRQGPPGARTPRVILILVFVVIAFSGVVRLVDLGRFPEIVFDEHYYVYDANAILHGDLAGSPSEPWKPAHLRSVAHPDLAKLLIAAGIAVFGDNAWGWRLPSALAGLALVALVFPLARRLGLSPGWAFAALLLVASDPMLVLESRLGLLDMPVALFTVLTAYLALRYAQSGCRYGWLLACGVSLGAAVACKWSGVLAALTVLVILAFQLRPRRQWGGALLRYALALLVVPVGVYLAAHIPYLAAGHGIGDWLHLQVHMARWGWGVHGDVSFASAPLTWPFLAHPIWYKWFVGEQGTVGLLAIGNPLLWWGASAAFVVMGALAITRRNLRLGLAPLLVAVLYLPWLLTSRQTYIYYMVPVIPFMGVLLAEALSRIAGSVPEGREHSAASAAEPATPGWRRPAAWVLCAVCVVTGLAYLPFALGYPVPFEYYRALTPFTTWR